MKPVFLDAIREWLREARSICALTGAGISAESGIPTFRGPGGLWKSYKAEDLATPGAFERDPLLVWEWYDWRRSVIAEVQPNAGHVALAEMERRVPEFTVVTQNVDGLHDRAGSRRILKVHGDIWMLRCTACRRSWEDLRPRLSPVPPTCACGAMARPGVVWFGEALPESIWGASVEAVERADLVLVIGTSAVVYPAAGLIPLAKTRGAHVVEVNVAETPVSAMVDVSWRAPSAEALPLLLTRE